MTRQRRFPVTQQQLGLLLSIALVLLLPDMVMAQAATPQAVTLIATEFAFTPTTVTLTEGQPVQLTIVNQGKLAHDLKSDIPIKDLTYQQSDNDPRERAQNARKGVLDIDFGVGSTAIVTFTPKQAGTYAFTCDVAGHAEAGMKGMFVVQAATAATPTAPPAPVATPTSQPTAAPPAAPTATTAPAATPAPAANPTEVAAAPSLAPGAQPTASAPAGMPRSGEGGATQPDAPLPLLWLAGLGLLALVMLGGTYVLFRRPR